MSIKTQNNHKKFLNNRYNKNGDYNPSNSTTYEPSSPPASFSPPPSLNAEQKVSDKRTRTNFLPEDNVVPLGKNPLKSAQSFNRTSNVLADNNLTSVSAYIPTPIAVLEQQKKEKKFESKIGEKRLNSELEKNSNLPVDLADDEILNPDKGSLVSLQRNKVPVPHKKSKIIKTPINQNGPVGIRINAAPRVIFFKSYYNKINSVKTFKTLF